MSSRFDPQPDPRPSRRDVLRAAALAPLPLWAPHGDALRWLPGGDDRCVVVIELAGGNDGLNTLIPLDDLAYAAARPALGEVRGRALELDDGYGLHPALQRVHGLMKEGLGTVVHGVGYPNPDRSHFRSRDPIPVTSRLIRYPSSPRPEGFPNREPKRWPGPASLLLGPGSRRFRGARRAYRRRV